MNNPLDSELIFDSIMLGVVLWVVAGAFVISTLEKRARANGHRVEYFPSCSVQCSIGNPIGPLAVIFWPIALGVYLIFHRRPVSTPN